MTQPVRLRLSRQRGFDLQAHSRAVNGLPAVNVARPGFWGNPFSIHPQHDPGRAWGPRGFQTFSVPTREDAVECFAEMMDNPSGPGERAYAMRQALPKLRGHNLACWCALDGGPCHADVLLRLATGITCEPVA